jgi:hypothetical protein
VHKIRYEALERWSELKVNPELGDVGQYINVSYDYLTTKKIDVLNKGVVMELPLSQKYTIHFANISNPLPEILELIPTHKFTLLGLEGLLVCPITNERLINPVFGSNGVSYSKNTATAYNNWCKNNLSRTTSTSAVRYHELMSTCNDSVINMVIKQICELVFGNVIEKEIEDLDFGKKMSMNTYSYWYILQVYNKKIDELSTNNVNIEINPYLMNKERVWNEVERIRNMMSKYQSEVKILSKRACDALIHDSKNLYCNNNIITHMRKQLKIPRFNDEYVYGTDYSFLDLSGITISKIMFKDCSFMCTNLSNTVFKKCRFERCYFYGTNFTGCLLVNCMVNRLDYYSYNCVGNPRFI